MKTHKETNDQPSQQDRIQQLHRCDPSRTALLVVDMQHGFLDQGAALEVPRGRDIVPNICRLIECCRAVGSPVIFTQFVCSPAVPTLIFKGSHRGAFKGKQNPGNSCAKGSCQKTLSKQDLLTYTSTK